MERINAFWIIAFVCVGSVSAGQIFSENWDSGTQPADFPNVPDVTWNGWETCDYCGDEGFSEITTVRAHSLPNSLHVSRRPNEHSTKDLWRHFSPTTEMTLSFWIYFDSSYANYGNNPDTEDYVHLMFLQTALSGSGVRMDIHPAAEKTVGGGNVASPPLSYPWPPTCVDSGGRGNLVINAPETLKGITHGREDLCFPVTSNLGRWIQVVWSYKIVSATEGRASLWIDGIERMHDELIPPDPNYLTIDGYDLSGYLSNTRSYGFDYYIDDILMTDSYEGSGGECVPVWQCTNWTTCSAGRQTRTCTDSNACGSITGKPAESQDCTVNCIHSADNNPCNGCIDTAEILAFVNRWKLSGTDVGIAVLIEAIRLWKGGGC
jgi:hypothetical protein